MPTADPRCHPLIELERDQLQAMLRPLLGGSGLGTVARVEGGLVNTLYRVTAGADAAYAVRVYASGRAAFESERRLLAALPGMLPVPEVLLADPGGRSCAHPFVVYRWIEGITLNEFRRRAAGEFLALAEPLGRLAARIAGIQPDDADDADLIPISRISCALRRKAVSRRAAEKNGEAAEDCIGSLRPLCLPLRLCVKRSLTAYETRKSGITRAVDRLPVVRVAVEVERAERQLRSGLARERLGGVLADGLRECLAAAEPGLLALERTRGLLHGDFGGRNVLVRAGEAGEWEISGILDWEEAAQGPALWDVGSLFRYSRRYSPEFRDRFARGYRAAGGELGRGWWRAAQLLDATRLVRTLNEERELPNVFAECRDLLAATLAREDSPAD